MQSFVPQKNKNKNNKIIKNDDEAVNVLWQNFAIL
jgi:hypothetical protein